MNPYETPSQSPRTTDAPAPVPANASAPDDGGSNGKPCPFCGSGNTNKDTLSHPSPSILFVIFFGWIFLLIRTAFGKQVDRCRDCGEVNTYKSGASKVAIIVLVVLVVLIALAAMEPA